MLGFMHYIDTFSIALHTFQQMSRFISYNIPIVKMAKLWVLLEILANSEIQPVHVFSIETLCYYTGYIVVLLV